METAAIHHLGFIMLFLMALVVALAALARRFRTPYPIVLVIGGLAVSLIPDLPPVTLNPDVIFLVLLPPLLFAAAFHTSWRDFRSNLIVICLLAFGLVGFTAAALTYISGRLIPGFDHRLGFLLGALVASTDAIAASAIARRVGLPKRIIDVLEGESLVNDATALVALELLFSMLVSNHVPTVGQGALRLTTFTVVGALIGLLAGKLICWGIYSTDVRLKSPCTTDCTVTFLHRRRVSPCVGVLATVACGLYLGNQRSHSLSIRARLNGRVLSTLDFVLNGLVFTLIGLQLPHILAGIHELRLPSLLAYGALLTGVLIALRMIWVFAESWISNTIRGLSQRACYSNACAGVDLSLDGLNAAV